MSISSVGGASALSQLYSTQQAQALSAADTPSGSTPEWSVAQTGDSNALTGTTTSNLDSQTLQALLELTQQVPDNSVGSSTGSSAGDPSASAQTGQAKGTHHHHHHHGGGMMQAQAASGDPSQFSAATTSGAGADAGAADASLEQVLMTA